MNFEYKNEIVKYTNFNNIFYYTIVLFNSSFENKILRVIIYYILISSISEFIDRNDNFLLIYTILKYIALFIIFLKIMNSNICFHCLEF